MSVFRSVLISLLYWPLRLLVRPHTIPSALSEELNIDPKKPILYVLHTDSVSDQVALSMSAKKLGLISPFKSVTLSPEESMNTCLYLHSPKPLFGKKSTKKNMEHKTGYKALSHSSPAT